MRRWAGALQLYLEPLPESPWTVVLLGIIAMLITSLLWIIF